MTKRRSPKPQSLRPITQEQARQWLIQNDPDGADYWRSLPRGSDFISAMREMIRDFG